VQVRAADGGLRHPHDLRQSLRAARLWPVFQLLFSRP